MEFHALLHCDNVIVTHGDSLILIGLAPAIDISGEPRAPHLTLFTQMAYVTYVTNLQTIGELEGLWWQINGTNNLPLITLPAQIVVPHQPVRDFGAYVHTGSFIITQDILLQHDHLAVLLFSQSPMSIIQQAPFPLIKSKEESHS